MKAADSIRQDATASEFESMTKNIDISEPVEKQKVDEGLIYEIGQTKEVENFDSHDKKTTAAGKD